jgi:hypothetical protein
VLGLSGEWHPFEATKSSLRLGSIAHLIRTSMARNARQINALFGAEVFSLAQQQFEKYGLRASNKPCDFNHIKNPYQIPVVQRSREKPRRENTDDAVCRFAGAELRRESPAKRGDFHVVASQERKLAMTRLAEGEEPESNILQLCPLSKYLDSQAFCKAIVPRGGSRKRLGRRDQVRIPLCPPNPQVRQLNHDPNQAPGPVVVRLTRVLGARRSKSREGTPSHRRQAATLQ